MELKNSQIHPFSKGKSLLWQEDKKEERKLKEKNNEIKM